MTVLTALPAVGRARPGDGRITKGIIGRLQCWYRLACQVVW